MVQNIAEYAEFRLLAPDRMAHGLFRATVMNVGVLFSGTPLLAADNKRQLLELAFEKSVIISFAHTVEGRTTQKLSATAGAGDDMSRFYYCARCGGSLTPTQCLGRCHQRYTPTNDIAFNRLQPALPIRVAAYMTQAGHRFTI